MYDADMKFTKTHEWVLRDGSTAIIGLTDYAQDQLGNIVFVDLPEIGDSFEREEECVVVESVKTASDLYAPYDCEVIAVNEKLSQEPSLVNKDAFGQGWILKIKITDSSEPKLMTKEEYAVFIKDQDAD